jgi:uncharacterized protein (DUF983 family)
MSSLGSAMFHCKCPRCREGNVFPYPVTDLVRFYKINDYCPHCGVSLNPEPGFYQGAMYVSYGFTVAMVAVVSVLLYVFNNPDEWVYVAANIGAMILLIPLNYRYSRIIFLYSFGGIRFDANKGHSER